MLTLAYPVSKLPQHVLLLKTSIYSTHLVSAKPSTIRQTAAFRVSAVSAPPDEKPGRLYSNLGPDRKHEPGSVLGAATLVSGTAVGAGILALPAVCAKAGFAASAGALTAAAGYSVFTGLLVAEVCVNTMCELGTGSGVSLGSMARRTLGENGARAVSFTYALLHYSLLVAYIAKAGETVSAATGFSQPVSDVGFTVALGLLCYASRPSVLDAANSVLVAGVLLSFVGLLALAAPGIDFGVLTEAHWKEIPPAMPVIALAFVFQNVVPVISSSLEGDITKIRTAIIGGLTVPLIMFLAWNAAVLGSASDIVVDAAVIGTLDPLAAVRRSADSASALVDAFSLLAVATSFIGFVLGLTEFVAEALGRPVGSGKELPYAVTLLPPLGLAMAFPGLFFKALDFAGTYGVLVLFGLVPVAMVWSERYSGTTISTERVAPGGRVTLILAGAAAVGVIANQLL